MTFASTHDRLDDPTFGHPFPQLRRSEWANLNGTWQFAHDDDDHGMTARWFESGVDARTIAVPFPPESEASTIGDTGFHPIIWYSRAFGALELDAAGRANQGKRVLLHFGAVDYRAQVWVNGGLVGEHAGGHTPFVLDITEQLIDGDNLLVVRAEDRPTDVGQPRGKQEWLPEARDIWYDRTSGIWQTVWLEAVPTNHIAELAWVPSRNCDSVRLELKLSRPVTFGAIATVSLTYEGEMLAEFTSALVHSPTASIAIDLRRQLNGQHYDKLLWSPEHPRLIEATVTVTDGAYRDKVASYFGLRSVGTDNGRFLLNDRPYFVRSVLEQGYWPESHLAAPSDDALRAEVELIQSLGFNAARLHQKFEDPRFLYWADRIGLLIWGEAPATYEFTLDAVTRLTAEWIEAIRRDRSHPCIVTWVPINESWGVQHISSEPAQRAFSRAIADLTRAIDPTRPVISNDGWEHTNSDILSIHDYDDDPQAIIARYADAEAVTQLFAGYGPAERRMMAEGVADVSKPVMVTEFGGIRFVNSPDATSWGYSTAATRDHFEEKLDAIFSAIYSSPVLAGFCYTQLTDTLQEANGLTDDLRRPKLEVATIRRIIMGKSLVEVAEQGILSPLLSDSLPHSDQIEA